MLSEFMKDSSFRSCQKLHSKTWRKNLDVESPKLSLPYLNWDHTLPRYFLVDSIHIMHRRHLHLHLREFTSAQERCLTFILYGLAISLAYPSGGRGVFYQLIPTCRRRLRGRGGGRHPVITTWSMVGASSRCSSTTCIANSQSTQPRSSPWKQQVSEPEFENLF